MFKKHSGIFIIGILLIVFVSVWIIKLRLPITNAAESASDGGSPWWEASSTQATPSETIVADPEWILDPEIPANYVPVIGEDELYMVIDEDGNIEKYRQRQKDAEGYWVWKDVNPHIPENYVAVEGLENVYRVEKEDGSVKYMRYTRNSDDTFFFTEVDENGKEIVDITPVTPEIPKNYIHLGNDIYAVYNEHGVLIGYMQRYLENGEYKWRECQSPLSQEAAANGGSSTIVPNSGNLNLPSGSGGSSGSNNSGSNSGSNMVVNIITGSNGEEEGYKETETFTFTETVDGWIVVYETKVTRIYDIHGELVSTKKEGPTEINRFPATDFNEELIPGINPDTYEYEVPSSSTP